MAICPKCKVGICQSCSARGESGEIICRNCADKERSKREEAKDEKLRRAVKARGGLFANGKGFLISAIAGGLMTPVAVMFLGLWGANLFNDGIGRGVAYLAALFYICMAIATAFGALCFHFGFASREWDLGRIAFFCFFSFWLTLVLAISFWWLIFPFYMLRFSIAKIRRTGAIFWFLWLAFQIAMMAFCAYAFFQMGGIDLGLRIMQDIVSLKFMKK